MKKIIMICAAVFCLNLNGFSQHFASTDNPKGGGLFGRGIVSDENYYGASTGHRGIFDYNNELPALPGHNLEGDQPAPIGSGTLLLLGFGAAYAFAKKRKEELFP